jgi:hypothetical protein
MCQFDVDVIFDMGKHHTDPTSGLFLHGLSLCPSCRPLSSVVADAAAAKAARATVTFILTVILKLEDDERGG